MRIWAGEVKEQKLFEKQTKIGKGKLLLRKAHVLLIIKCLKNCINKILGINKLQARVEANQRAILRSLLVILLFKKRNKTIRISMITKLQILRTTFMKDASSTIKNTEKVQWCWILEFSWLDGGKMASLKAMRCLSLLWLAKSMWTARVGCSMGGLSCNTKTTFKFSTFAMMSKGQFEGGTTK